MERDEEKNPKPLAVYGILTHLTLQPAPKLPQPWFHPSWEIFTLISKTLPGSGVLYTNLSTRLPTQREGDSRGVAYTPIHSPSTDFQTHEYWLNGM